MLVPGADWGPGGEGTLRLCAAGPPAAFREGVRRAAPALAALAAARTRTVGGG